MKKTKARRGFIVAGMHRSGTSALTRTLSLLGAKLPGKLLPAKESVNPKGFWEGLDIVELNANLLATYGFTWEDIRPLPPDWLSRATMAITQAENLLSANFSGVSSFVLKDPRICRLLPLWVEAVRRIGAKPLVILQFRHPFEVAESLARRDGFGTDRSLLLWIRHVIDAERDSRAEQRTLLDYRDLMADWRAAIDKLYADLDLSRKWARSKEIAVDEFIDQSLYHNRDAAERSPSGRIEQLAIELYEALRSGGNPLSSSCDRINAEVADLLTSANALAEFETVAHRNKAVLARLIRSLAAPNSERLKFHLAGNWYLEENPDIAAAGVDPYDHWLNFGAEEGRLPARDPVGLVHELISDRDQSLQTRLEEAERTIRTLEEESRTQLRQFVEREQVYTAQVMELRERCNSLQAELADSKLHARHEVDAHLRQRAEREEAFAAQLAGLNERFNSERAKLEAGHADRERRLQQDLKRLEGQLKLAQEESRAQLKQLAEREQAFAAQLSELRGRFESERAEFATTIERIRSTLETEHASRERQQRQEFENLQESLRRALDESRESAQSLQIELAQSRLRARNEMEAHSRQRAEREAGFAAQLAELHERFNAERAALAAEKARLESKPSPGIRAANTLEQLLALDGDAFLTCAYLTLLGRHPEPEGRNFYLNRLRQTGSKMDVVYGIYRSPEAARLGRTLPGLDAAIRRTRWLRLPVFGALLKTIVAGHERSHTGTASSPAALKRHIKSESNRLIDSLFESFDGDRYLDAHPDVRSSGVNPYEHFIRHGWREGRHEVIFEPVEYAENANLGLPPGNQENPRGNTMDSSSNGSVRDSDKPAFCFELDRPQTRHGVAVDPVTDRLTVEGWALARDGVAEITVSVDNKQIGSAFYGTARPDVGAAYPNWANASRSGYVYHFPHRALAEGEHVITLTVRSEAGGIHEKSFSVTVEKVDHPEAAGAIRRKVGAAERMFQASILDRLGWRPRFEIIVVSASRTQDAGWDLTLRSILEQSWPNWRVCAIANDPGEAEMIRELIASLSRDRAGDFTVVTPDATDLWPAAPSPDNTAALFAFLRPGDELGHDALGAFAIASGQDPTSDFFYADEFRVPPGASRPEPFYKPDFSPTLQLSFDYIGRPLVLRSTLVSRIGVTPQSLRRDGFYDLALLACEHARSAYHIPELLGRTDAGSKGVDEDGAAALARALSRRGIPAEVADGQLPGTFHVRRTSPPSGKVSVVIPTCAAKGHIETCLKTLRSLTAYGNFEVICAENIPAGDRRSKEFVRSHSDKVLPMPRDFNWSRFNNLAADAADGEYLLFLNDDVEIIEPGWLEAMLHEAARPEVGVVGARLLYPNRTIQHAGMFLGAGGMARHAFRHAAESDPGYFGQTRLKREVIAITGACMMVRREVFRRLGGFDEKHDVINNDLDFCLRAHREGFLTIYTPDATLIHHELASREDIQENFDPAGFDAKWRTLFAAGDPYFNVHLARDHDDYRVEGEGIRTAHAGHPLIDRRSVKSILAVKLDHIGDFVTALPALRRLKESFPGARLTVLAAPASLALASVEPAIDECIPFEFFHARSELGEKEVSEDELQKLAAQLAPYRFDIAVDLRKHLSTRYILRYSGARLLAGYDWNDQFPWLDISLEWGGDKALSYKHSHVTDDLVNLVAAIDSACEPNRNLIQSRPVPMGLDELPAGIRPLFDRPVVTIHPGAGNVMRQWPAAHQLTLIDLLLERHDISVLLIGGKDDEPVATWLIEHAARSDRIGSAVGIIPLRDLPRLLTASRLFIGNNSGPKHIAAALGVPTIGVHSGVVDPGEWAPLGERALSVYRNMSCAPCYHAKAEDCPRNLACIQQLEPAHVYRLASLFLDNPKAATGTSPSSGLQTSAPNA